jgi:ribosomal protein S18 acetylase RimI-like enzyme
MGNKIEIYDCRVEDVDDSVKKLWLALSREMFEVEHFIIPSQTNSDRWSKFVREGLVSGRNFLLVARNESRLVGFAYASVPHGYPLDVSEPVGVIDDVYVLPEFRGMGVGKKLVVKCLNKMEAMGVNVVRLKVLSENKTAIKFYRKFGFRIYSYGMVKALKH